MQDPLIKMKALIEELNVKLPLAIKEVIRTGRKGEVNLKITIEKSTDESVVIDPKVTVREPSMELITYLVNVDKNGNPVELAQHTIDDYEDGQEEATDPKEGKKGKKKK